jgi:hypothetical protein
LVPGSTLGVDEPSGEHYVEEKGENQDVLAPVTRARRKIHQVGATGPGNFAVEMVFAATVTDLGVQVRFLHHPDLTS